MKKGRRMFGKRNRGSDVPKGRCGVLEVKVGLGVGVGGFGGVYVVWIWILSEICGRGDFCGNF